MTPMERNEDPLVRFAFLYDALKINGIPSRKVMSFNLLAISTVVFYDSTTHGPAIKKRFDVLDNV